MKVCVFGLGRIGLPIALVCADSGYEVTGIDINYELIEKLRDKKAPFDEPHLQELLTQHVGTKFVPKHQDEDVVSDLEQAEYIMLAVGTGFARYPEDPDLSTLYSIIGQLIAVDLTGKTLILRVTLPIGTSDKVKELIESKTKLREGKDFWFSFVPERIMEGKAVEEERSLPKIIGTYSDKGFDKVSSFFENIGGEMVRVSDPRTAEFIKLIDNSWRNTRFAFANELAFLAEENNIDVMEAISSANAGYDRNAIPKPGPVSGYCLGKDPYLLEFAFISTAEKRGFNSMWYYGRRANDWLIDKIVEEVDGETVLVAGLSFKEDIDDFRYSHGVAMTKKLLEEGYTVFVHDPYLDKNEYTRLPKDLQGKVRKIPSLNDITGEVDVAIFASPHQEYLDFDISSLPDTVHIVDLWGIYRNYGLVSYTALGLRK